MTTTDAGQDRAIQVSDEMVEAYATAYANAYRRRIVDNVLPSERNKAAVREGLAAALATSGWRSEADVREVHESWKATYEAKVQEFAAETRRTSILIRALHDAGHRAEDFVKNRYCGRCEALRQVGAIDPKPWGETGR